MILWLIYRDDSKFGISFQVVSFSAWNQPSREYQSFKLQHYHSNLYVVMGMQTTPKTGNTYVILGHV